MGTTKRERQKELHRAKLDSTRSAERRATRIRRAAGIGAAVLTIVIFAAVVSAVQSDDSVDLAADDTTTDSSSTDSTQPELVEPEFVYGTTPCPGPDAPEQIDFEDGFVDCLDPAKSYTATFQTNLGEVVVELDTERTPGTTNNFVNLARHRYYDDTLIFRIDGSLDIAQGGSPHTNDNSDPGPGYTITDEGGPFDVAGTVGPFTYEPGQLVMARSQGPNSGGAQYFLTLGPDVSALDSQGTYVTFGQVTQGLDVLTEMLALEDPDNPGTPVRLLSVETVTITES
ncbi:MAG TPA: peptidylprolyl isomerase [Acidimicrobiales bacterium]|nr:peptidylprolyl isomerase [Acidimicrobiales bacterium]